MDHTPCLGSNDADGIVSCGLCEWRAGPFRSMEVVEFALQTHLQQAHGKKLYYRIQGEDGKMTTIPPLEAS